MVVRTGGSREFTEVMTKVTTSSDTAPDSDLVMMEMITSVPRGSGEAVTISVAGGGGGGDGEGGGSEFSDGSGLGWGEGRGVDRVDGEGVCEEDGGSEEGSGDG